MLPYANQDGLKDLAVMQTEERKNGQHIREFPLTNILPLFPL